MTVDGDVRCHLEDDGTLSGEISFHLGDESTFKARAMVIFPQPVRAFLS
jgi:hypothetical protein